MVLRIRMHFYEHQFTFDLRFPWKILYLASKQRKQNQYGRFLHIHCLKTFITKHFFPKQHHNKMLITKLPRYATNRSEPSKRWRASEAAPWLGAAPYRSLTRQWWTEPCPHWGQRRAIRCCILSARKRRQSYLSFRSHRRRTPKSCAAEPCIANRNHQLATNRKTS